MSEVNVVETWLGSFDLGKYAQSFIDNGYDDLEICKQVGTPDLDAIGVESADDRNKILEEVKVLNEKGGSHVYLTLADESKRNAAKSINAGSDGHVPTRPTLENLLSDVPPPAVSSPSLGTRPASAMADRSSAATLITYPKLQLSVLLRDKLVEDEIDLASPPYTAQDLSPCWSGLTALAVKYKDELQTYLEDVLDRLEDLRWRRIIYEDAMSIYTPPSMTSSTMEDPYSPTGYSYSPRGGPPPIPSVPPPEGSHIAQYGRDNYGQLQSVHTRYRDSPNQANYVSLDTGMCCVFPKKVTKADTEASSEKKKTSTLGRLFRNMGFRRSSRKHSYKKHQGTGDPLAHEITMGDNDRIALMQMVKEGKISTETAIQVVKRFEEDRKKDDIYIGEKEKDKKNSKSKKGSSIKPTKSPSVIYADDSQCDVCHNFLLHGYPADDYSRQRRVHSVSHIPYHDPLRSPGAPRAMSCSPMRSQSAQPSAVNSPVTYAQGSKIYTPVIPHELKMFSGPRGHYAVHSIDVLRDRLNVIKTSACVHKTQSKASLISSESDHSMDCASMMSQAKPQVEETYYCSNYSTVSMGSDTDPGANGRRKCGNNMEKQHNHKWQRTGSLSQGEDGMSTDNEELDDPDQYLLGGGSSHSHMMEKFRGVKNEMRKRILQTRDIIGDGKSQHLCSAYQPAPGTSHSVSSNDSNCSSGVGSQSTHSDPAHRQQQPLPWAEPEQSQGHFHGNIVGHARVHSEYTPSPEEKDFLHLRRGERVQILEATSTGIWKGRIDNRVGYFHFNFVDMIAESTPTIQRKDRTYRQSKRRSKPRSVEELLQRINLEHLAPVFVMNGYDNLEIFAEIDHEDLNALSIFDSESRTKLLTAAELLNDYEVVEPGDGRSSRFSRSASATPTSQQYAVPWTSFFPTPKPPTTGSRDSGCYDSSECMNRDNYDPYACVNRNKLNLHDKENYRPYAKKSVIKPENLHGDLVDLSLTYGANAHQGATGPNGARLEKIYSEEDREVCDITGYHSNGTHGKIPKVLNLSAMSDVEKLECSLQNRNLNLNIPVLGPEWKVFQDTSSQTSPKYGSMSDSFHGSLEGDLSAISSSMSASAHGDFFSHSQSTLKKKSKPYARRVAPVVPMKDAQVQVMCPLGFSPQQFSPGTSTPVSTPTVSQTTDQFIVNPSSSLVFLDSNQSENGDQTASLVIAQNPSSTRMSYMSQASQNSREGDSGSDASTVKSDQVQDGTDTRGVSENLMQDGSTHKAFKSIKRSVIPKVTSKLASENIDLSLEPYTSQSGACGIPPLLIQRYAEELKQDLYKTALILDQVRIHKLTTLGRATVMNEKISESSLGASELKIGTITEFFISIGLPMYAESFITKGYTNVEALAVLSVKELQSISKAEKRHLKRIIHALEWVQNRLASPTRKQKVSPVKDRV